ncbi:unnamed protein product [Brassicogethes aeneus]|uniref:G-protein coupled receptors family 1 profile domain-containing protein n=1 Tax=Brassicogethes aeneus TaxID=1431903 RepID=A0A9P0AZM0_BRAAE|nr:unnamed protein product [Brassicogethes aeneus]
MMFAYSMMGRTLCYVTPPCDHNEGLSSTQQVDQTGGNGFLNNTENNFGSPSQNKKAGARRLQSVVPVVIRQIRDCHEDEFKMFGMPTQIVIAHCWYIKSYEVQSTKATYNIEDHTGTIKAIWWLENDDDTTPNLPPVKEGSYLQLFGSLRNQDGEKIIMVLRMFMVDDANLITSHLLQVIQTRLQAEHMSQNSGTIKPNIQNPGTALPNSMSFMDDNNISSGLTAIQAKVQRLLQTDQSTAGMHRDVLLKNFPSNQQTEVKNRVVRSRKRVAIILLLLAFVFAACWLPYHIINLLMDTGLYHGSHSASLQQYLLLLGHANSALNPVIYCALSKKFRSSIKDIFYCRITFRRKRPLMNVSY